jgi:membrane-associated protease RseP (regulator of RpoE activity)
MTPYVEKHDLTSVAPTIEGPLVTGVEGPLRVAVANIAALRLGGITVDSVPVGLGRERRSFLAFEGIDGLAGSTLFHGGRLILDYYRHRAIVEPVGGVGRDCKYDESGLILTARSPDYHYFAVRYVVDHSPAGDAGIRPGDQILSIDDRPTDGLRLPEIRQLLTVDGATRQLRLLRGADTMSVTLVLRRLF